MSTWNGASAIVTGAASGIGLALSEGMIARGVEVWLTDVNLEGVKAAAERLGAKAHAEELDVRDAAAVQDLVDRVAQEHGRLDYMFNNAGIGAGGELQDVNVAHFDRVIDINVRGVTNGVAAAYPLMVKQGHGHIVNTASAAGLLPTPLLTPYSMTKHAVVGLSLSSRFEGENYGVKVSALCPTAIETPLLDSDAPPDLDQIWRPDVRGYLSKIAAPMPVKDFAEYSLDQIEKNKDLIIAPAKARIIRFLYRLIPSMLAGTMRASLKDELRKRPKG